MKCLSMSPTFSFSPHASHKEGSTVLRPGIPSSTNVRLAGQAPTRSWSDTRCVTHDASFMSASLGTAASSPSRICLAQPMTRSAVSFKSSVNPSDQRATYLCEP